MSDSTITKKFSVAFNAKDSIHVLWFRSLHLATLKNESIVADVLETNPFGIAVSKKDLIECVNIQFILAMKYSTCVLDGNAWVPPLKNFV